MSQLSADTLMPLFAALPVEEQHSFAEKISKMLKPKAAPQKKKDIYDRIGDKYRPENREILVGQIMRNEL